MPPAGTPRAGAAGSDEPLVKAADAARALGISLDTLRRWDRESRIRIVRDGSNRRMVPRQEIERLSGRAPRNLTGSALSARNRLPGVVRSVEADGVMAIVEIEAGPFRVAAAITRDAVEELGLAPGVAAVATIKATSVMVSREGGIAR
jgi:molybdopterin-binding protein